MPQEENKSSVASNPSDDFVANLAELKGYLTLLSLIEVPNDEKKSHSFGEREKPENPAENIINSLSAEEKKVLQSIAEEIKNLLEKIETRWAKKLKSTDRLILRTHYSTVVETLLSALKDPKKSNIEKLNELADASPASIILHTLAGLIKFAASALTALSASYCLTMAPMTYGASMLPAIPLTLAANKLQNDSFQSFNNTIPSFHKYQTKSAAQTTVKKMKTHHTILEKMIKPPKSER
jgi:hypothetical protein